MNMITILINLSLQRVRFIFNAQHDCLTEGCEIEEVGFIRQERNTTSRPHKAVLHRNQIRFFLNMHGLHNAALIRQALPRRFSKPTHYLEDRTSKHQEYAVAAKKLIITKRAEATARAKATRARNKAAAEAPESRDNVLEELVAT